MINIVIRFTTKLHVGVLGFNTGIISGSVVVELKQEAFLAQNVHAPVRLEQAVQFVGQTAHTPDELMY